MYDVYEKGRTKLEELASWYKDHMGDRNEATTRLHLIDSLFFDCLAWTKDDVIAEESHNGKYADYCFMAPRRILIVEAKREGKYFELPAGISRLEYSLSSVARDNPPLEAALRQVADYCQDRGVPIGVVCNGHQLVAFVATRNDGTPPLEGRGLVFTSLEQMLEEFMELWEALSKPGIEQKRVLKRLLGDKSTAVPPKLSSSLVTYPGTKGRNSFQVDLQILSELVLEDVTRTRDLEPMFLRECYCKSGALSQYSVLSKEILEARYTALFDSDSPGPVTVPAATREGISSDLLARSLSRRPILLIGDVGVGKTTFIRHLHKVHAAELLSAAITLYIDLGTQATLAPDLREFILDEIAKQLREDYEVDTRERNLVRGVYNLDLERFRRGIHSDLRETDLGRYREKEIEFLEERIQNTQEHLRRTLRHLVRGRKQQVVIFIDNADQRTDSIQQEAFLIAQELAHNWPATVFVALRPETFHRSHKSGTLSGYHPKAFTISPPRIDQVLRKRLRFALKITGGEIPVQDLTGFRMRLESLDALIRVFLYSIGRNRELVEFIDNICGGNVRLALDLVRGFFSSGHVDTQKIVDIYSDQESYLVPLHEFLRAVIFGDSEYYHPDRSPIANLYDVSYADPKEHFLLPILLCLLATGSGNGASTGFTDTGTVYDRLQALGFTPEQVDAAIARAARHKLIESSSRSRVVVDQPMPKALRATTIGVYHARRLCRLFAYTDAMIVDTPIFSSEARDQLRDVHTIRERLKRVQAFRDYLDQQWAGLEEMDTIFDWRSVSSDLGAQVLHIKDRVRRS